MNQATRNTVDAFVESIYGDIETAQTAYKANNREDSRYEDGRFFNEAESHVDAPADATNTTCTYRWTDDLLPESMPCKLRASMLEYRGDLGWLLYVNYIDDGVEYYRTISTLGIKANDWMELFVLPEDSF